MPFHRLPAESQSGCCAPPLADPPTPQLLRGGSVATPVGSRGGAGSGHGERLLFATTAPSGTHLSRQLGQEIKAAPATMNGLSAALKDASLFNDKFRNVWIFFSNLAHSGAVREQRWRQKQWLLPIAPLGHRRWGRHARSRSIRRGGGGGKCGSAAILDMFIS